MKRASVSGLAGLIALLLGAMVLAIAAPAVSARENASARPLAEGAGMSGKPSAAVRRLQRQLRARGHSLGPAGVDGRFGPRTASAVRGLQSSFGLHEDGVVGPKTRKLLRVVCKGNECLPGQNKRVSARPPADALAAPPPGAPRSSPDGSLSPAAPTVVAILALLVLALGFGWWRSERGSPATGPEGDMDGPEATSPRVVAYLGESPNGYGNPSGVEVEAQEEELEAECRRRGWELVEVLGEVPGGRDREALVYALERIGAGDATCLMVGRMERVGGSVNELGRLLEWLGKVHASLVVLDVGVDTTSPEGARAANVLVSVTRAERRQSVVRTGNGWRAYPLGRDE
jgi:peptidoglycan hydrolase-like protein with peptidoglycan-binding domain